MDLKQLEQVIRLCRKMGVSTISIEGVTLTLTPEAPVSQYKKRAKKAPLSPFEQALSEAKDVATKAKLQYMAQQAGQQLTPPPSPGLEGPIDELSMLLWSSGGGDGAGQ